MTDIVRLLRLDHDVLRRQFADLYLARPVTDRRGLAQGLEPLIALLIDHDAATRALVDGGIVNVDSGRRADLLAASGALRQAIADTNRHECGDNEWWEAINALHRVYRDDVLASDEAMVELLRAALDNSARHRIGQQWLERDHAATHTADDN